jgi:Na+/H+ antiporter NhaD/arsenite permease-like protein
VVFAGAYLGLALGRLPFFRVDRTGVAIIGAAILVVTGVLSWEQAVTSVDAHTLVLLFGMMIVAAYLRLSGFFRLVTHAVARRARTPAGLLGLITVAAGVLSALFVNDVICLVMAPIVLDLVRQLRLPPVPYLIALATAANVGSVATLTGNPQNMLVGSFSGIDYRMFLLREAPVAALGLALVFLAVWLVYRRALPPTLPVASLQERFTVHYPLMIKTIVAVSIKIYKAVESESGVFVMRSQVHEGCVVACAMKRRLSSIFNAANDAGEQVLSKRVSRSWYATSAKFARNCSRHGHVRSDDNG